MSSENENEIRVEVPNPEEMKTYLETSYGKPSPYAFTDTMYKPKGTEYDNDGQYTLCIREWHYGLEGVKFMIKYALKKYSNGEKSQKFGFKLPVDSLDIAQEVMATLNMERLFSFRRDSLHYHDNNNDVEYFLENVEHLGWALEIEAQSNLREVLKQLEKSLKQTFTIQDKSTLTYVWVKLQQ